MAVPYDDKVVVFFLQLKVLWFVLCVTDSIVLYEMYMF